MPEMLEHRREKKRPGRERAPGAVAPDALREGRIETNISRRVAWSMIAVFAVMIYGVPLVQLSTELLRRKSPQVFELFSQSPAKEHLREWEDELSRISLVKNHIQPLLQEALSGTGGFGNTQVVIGREGWLFYRPGIDYVAGQGFLQDQHFAARRRKALKDLRAVPQSDPRRAIVEFHQQCAQFGARLLIVPVPDKAMLQPAELSTRFSGDRATPPANNPDFRRFVAELQSAGVDVFDPTPREIVPGEERFLIQDTHWTPQWMQQVATDLAAHVRRLGVLSDAPPARFQFERQTVSRLGDLVDMLKLNPSQDVFAPQPVAIRRIVEPQTHAPWHADPQAEVLLLGDSFTNIFSLAEMGWGDSAGFAEQLSDALARPIDRISRNDSGAFATRQLLAAELAKGRNRLAGKKLVIWQFAVRELAVGDWKSIELKLGAAPATQFVVPAAGQERIVSGTIRQIARAPKPGTVPYKDHIVGLHLVDLSDDLGPIAGGEALVYVWSMRDNVWTDAATWQPDRTVRLHLRPWSDVADRLEAINRGEVNDDELNLQEPCWGEEVQDE
jgi:alginate O-acetyltransferase complex protein AlgJ